ncbi:MAG: DNA cytosine methyltransferase [Patescibacteria group bacterium]|nr:DNA cytosine methyltransferase [Patescibacteria group bacterium]
MRWRTRDGRRPRGGGYSVSPPLMATGRGTDRTGDSRGQDCVIPVLSTTGDGYWQEDARTLRARNQESHEHLVASTGDISHCLNAGGMGRIDYETETLVTHALRAEEHDASEDGTGRGTPLVPVAFQGKAFHTQTVSVGETTPALDVGKSDGMCVAFSCKDHGADAGAVSPTLRAMEFHGSHANGGGQVAVAFEPRYARNGRGAPDEIATPLKAESGADGRGDGQVHVSDGYRVRRITPIEAARLQGFPDLHAHIDRRPRKIEPDEAEYYMRHWLICWQEDGQWWTKVAADGPIYKAYGNSMAVPCMRWIGERIRAVEEIIGSTDRP